METTPFTSPGIPGAAGRRSSSIIRKRFGSGTFWMLHARFAYFSVLFVSSKSASDGEMHVMSTVSELPPSESCTARSTDP